VIVRRPAVAGSFYSAQADQLRHDVVKLLADAGAAVNIASKALIAPHAGYIYSGSIAAAAFATLHDSRQTLKRIVLIGPAHYVAIGGIALPTVDAFETPLGCVPVDRAGLNEIAGLPFVSRNDAAHAPEHALEVVDRCVWALDFGRILWDLILEGAGYGEGRGKTDAT
jgi:MEMO1 family protein